jgi:hypothetical protein
VPLEKNGVIDLLAGLGLLDSNGLPTLSASLLATVLASVLPAALLGTGTAWITPTLLNSWVPFGGSSPPAGAQYRKDGFGFVHLRGAVKNGTVGTSIFTLPAGFRPAYALNYVFPNAAGSSAAGAISFGVAGSVTPAIAAGKTWVGLDLPPFLAEN